MLPDLQLPAAGRLDGTVIHKAGAAADGVTVSWSNRSDVTKNGGHFDLGLVSVGNYALSATSADGDAGAGSASVAAGASANASIRLNGVGRVEVTVRNASLALAPNAAVSVSSSAPFPRSHTGQKTGPAGEPVTYDRVLSGTITATASLAGLGGETTGFLDDSGLLRLTVKLDPAGRISGVVTRREGGAASASVHLTGPKNATVPTDALTGAFAFENVPFGHFQLSASTPEGDFGSAQGDLTVANPDVTAPITLNGLGTVTVHVKDADGVEVPGAHVTVTSLGRSSGADADGTGTATLVNVLAAPSVHATATHPTNGARGDEDGGPLAAVGTLTIDVALERLGTVSGTVFGPDGQTPVDGVDVRLSGSVITHDGGQFAFTNLKLGTHTLSAYVGGRLRAQASVLLNGPEALKNLVLVGVGTVSGTVTRSGGAPAVDANIRLQSDAPIYGGFFDTKSVAGGAYEIHGVPIGSFTISATLGADTRQKDETVTHDGEQVDVDLELLDSAIALPRTFRDGNDLWWTLSADGSLDRGMTFNGGEGTPRLTVERAGTSVSFTGPACAPGVKCAPTEANGREVVLRQADLLGLEVTRKVFVPADGYFIRVVDFLRNPPTASEATVSVLREARVGGTTVVSTSSDDAAVGSDDDWVAIDDALDDDIYRLGTHTNNLIAPTAFVLAGPGRPATSSLVASQPAANRTLLTQQWDDVTIAPGQTVAFLSLFAGQADRGRAVASAKRLVQLPPEALAGLSTVEAGQVVNFAVPADLASSVPPLPPNDGIVSGRALASDGQTPSDNGGWTSVEFRSRSPYYGRPLTKVPQSSPPGFFIFEGAATPDLPALVPRWDFDLTANAGAGADVHPFAVPPALASVAVSGQGVIDLTNVVGRVLRVSSSSGNSWQTPEMAVDDDLTTSWHTASGDAANRGQSPFVEIGLPGEAKVHEVRVRGTNAGESYSIHAGRIDLLDVSGAVLWSEDVLLPLVDGRRDGDFPVPAVLGVRSIRFTSTDDRSNNPGLSELRVLGEANLGPAREAKQDLVFRGTGMLEARVLRSDLTLVPSSQVWLSDGTRTTGPNSVGASGSFLWRILPPGTYTVFARHPTQSPVVSVGDVVVSADALKRQDVVFEPFGSIGGTVTTAKNGVIAAGLRLQAPSFQTRSRSSNATTGLYEFTDVPPGAYTLSVTDNRTGFEIARQVTVAAGPATPADFTLRPVTTIAINATLGSPSGPPVGFAPASVEEEPGRGFRFVGYVINGSLNVTATGPTVTVRVETTGTQIPSVGEDQATFDEGDPVELPIVLPGLGTVAGKLRARDGKVVATGTTLNVLVANPDDPTKQISTPVTGDGSFRLNSVPVRPLLLRSEVIEGFGCCWSYSVAEVPVALSAHEETVQQDALAAVGDIGHPGLVDAWEVQPAAGASITLLLSGRDYADVTALPDPLLEVYAPDGTPVAANDNRSGSDKKSELGFIATGGPYVILARGAKGSTGGYRLASWAQDENHVFRPWNGRLFSGVVTRLEDGAPAAGQGLRLLRRGAVPAEDVVLVTLLAADPQGAFSFPGLWSGSLALEAIDAQGIALARREFDVEPGEDPGPLDLVVPVHGTVTVHVMRGLDPVSGVEVEVESARTDVLPGDKTRRATTVAGGSVSFSMPIGAVTARAVDPARPGSSPVAVPGAVAEAVPADLTIDFGIIRVDVQGVVRNSSLTPVPGATVELVGFGTSPPTGNDGVYRFTNVPGARSWTIKASHPKATAPQSVTLVLGDQNVQRDFTLALPMLVGRVVEPDGTGVAGATVQVCGSYYYDPCLPTDLTSVDGSFIFTGRPSWTSDTRIVVELQDGSGLRASLYNVPFYYYTTGTVTQNVTLPPTGSVTGTVKDHEGTEVSGAPVSLSLQYTYGSPRSAVTDAEGFYEFRHVQLYERQPVRVYAESPAGDPGETRGTLEPGQELSLDVSLLEGAELQIRLLDETRADLGGAVTVQALLAPGAYEGTAWSRSVDLVAGDPVSGRVHVPLGPFRVVHDDPTYDPGAAEGELGSGDSLPVTVERGSHVRQPQQLGGPEGSFTTDEWCWRSDCGPIATTVVPGLRESYPPYLRREAQDRALRSLQLAGVGLRVQSQQYVPPSGAFARTLTTLRNTTDAPMTVVLTSTLRLDLGYNPSGSFGVGDPVGVVADGDNLLALVLGSRLESSRAEFRPAVGGEVTNPGALDTDHIVPIGPRKTVAFLTYSLAASDGDPDALAAKAAALVDLSHPEALAGLTSQERAVIVNFDVPPLGDVEGSVSFGGTGIEGAQIGLVDAAGELVAETTTGENGAFAFNGVPPGSYSAAAFDSASGRRGRVAVDVVAGVVSPAPIALLDDAALGAVHVRAVWERVPGLVADAELTLSVEGFGPIGQATVVTDANGEGLFTGIPAGATTVRWPDYYRAGPGTVTVVAGQTVDLELVAPPPGNVWGRVRGAGGSVAVPYARVEALDVATDELLASSMANDAGAYQLVDVRAGALGFKVRAIWQDDPAVWAERAGSVSQAFETIQDFDLELPIAAVTGQVYFDGGTEAVASPTVFATPTGVADPRTYYASESGLDGTFTVLVGGAGDYVVTGQDNDSGLTGQAPAHVADLAAGADVPVVLQPSGSVTVTVSRQAVRVSPALVALSSLGLAFDRIGDGDQNGSLTFDRVALGRIHVQAVETSGIYLAGSSTAELVGAGASATVPITLPETATLEGQVLGVRNGYAEVRVRSLEHDGPLGPTNVNTYAGPSYSVEVPVGPIRVGAVDYSDAPLLAGLAEDVVPPSGAHTIDVTLGNAAALAATLTGADGFRYVVECAGNLSGGGISDGNEAYGTASNASLAGRGFPSWPCLPAAAAQGGRELEIGPRDVVGIRMTRKVYVPPSGGFARYLEILTNPGDAPVTLPVSVDGVLASDWSTRIVASPASTGRTYALTDSSECCRPILGHVFAGPGASAGLSMTHFNPGDGYFFYRWTVTIGPGETVVLMHFAVQWDRLDTAGARQQAEALANLTDPHALDGMTPLERSQVVNFDVP